MCANLQLVSLPLNPGPIVEHVLGYLYIMVHMLSHPWKTRAVSLGGPKSGQDEVVLTFNSPYTSTQTDGRSVGLIRKEHQVVCFTVIVTCETLSQLMYVICLVNPF